MDINGILIPILIVVGIVVIAVLGWLFFELVKTVKSARAMLDNMEKQLTPMMTNIEEMTDSAKPTVAKLDPLMDRVLLTMDSVNLEMMRVDRILENVGDITDSASSATNAVDNIANAPIKAVAKMTDRVKVRINSRNASEESAALSDQRTAAAQAMEDYHAAEQQEAVQMAKQASEAMTEAFTATVASGQHAAPVPPAPNAGAGAPAAKPPAFEELDVK